MIYALIGYGIIGLVVCAWRWHLFLKTLRYCNTWDVHGVVTVLLGAWAWPVVLICDILIYGWRGDRHTY